ncbi:hypothetical protein CARUB_v10017017mg, partial [Capsella rubella]
IAISGGIRKVLLEVWSEIVGIARGSLAYKVSSSRLSVHSHSNFVSLLSFRVFLCFVWLQSRLITMSQSSLVKSGGSRKQKVAMAPKRKIKILMFDNAALIEGYSKTMIGRCMNPRMQDMKSLLFMLPRIWQLENRVVGADLGIRRFQFDFDREEDIAEVLKMELFHFDYWMLSLVRWEPSVDASYPSAVKFWIRVLGVPLQYWADPTFRSIGEALGFVEEVDINGGRVRVILDGFKPLCFETEMEFSTGDEVSVTLRYERLFGYCRRCFSLCHDEAHCCPPSSPPTHPAYGDDGSWRNQSYRGAVNHDRRRGAKMEKQKGSHPARGEGEGTSSGNKKQLSSSSQSVSRGRSGFYPGESSHRPRRQSNRDLPQEPRKPIPEVVAPVTASMEPREVPEVESKKKQVKKPLFQEEPAEEGGREDAFSRMEDSSVIADVGTCVGDARSLEVENVENSDVLSPPQLDAVMIAALDEEFLDAGEEDTLTAAMEEEAMPDHDGKVEMEQNKTVGGVEAGGDEVGVDRV